jgi:hypothetical protein
MSSLFMARLIGVNVRYVSDYLCCQLVMYRNLNTYLLYLRTSGRFMNKLRLLEEYQARGLKEL